MAKRHNHPWGDLLNQPTNPHPHPPQHTQFLTPVPPAKRRRAWPWIVGALAAAVILIAGVSIGASLSNPQTKPATASTTPAAAAARPAAAPATPAVAYGTSTPQDFKLAVKILEKKCFGSAGCNITFQVDPTYVGALPLDPSTTYRVTYEVRGVEDGPAVNNFELTGGTASLDSEEFAQTSSSKTKVTARVTDVAEE